MGDEKKYKQEAEIENDEKKLREEIRAEILDELEAEKEASKKSVKESIYDKIPLNVKQLDIIIFILVTLFFVFFIIGALKGNGVI